MRTKAASTLMEIFPETMELPCASVTFTVNAYVLAALVIVPLTTPAAERFNPAGSVLPEGSDQVNGPTPPVCTMVAEYVCPVSPVVGNVPDVVTASTALIVMLRLLVDVCGVGVAESVTVTVKGNVPAVVGVPKIVPEPLRLRPAGKLPDVTAQV